MSKSSHELCVFTAVIDWCLISGHKILNPEDGEIPLLSHMVSKQQSQAFRYNFANFLNMSPCCRHYGIETHSLQERGTCRYGRGWCKVLQTQDNTMSCYNNVPFNQSIRCIITTYPDRCCMDTNTYTCTHACM